jgi:hypothetical protein
VSSLFELWPGAAKTEGGLMETGETFADRVFSAAAMLGAVGGAAAGAALGADTSDVFPALWGALGTVLGSAVAAGVGYGLVRLCAGNRAEQNSAPNHSRELTPTASAG